MIDYKKEVEYVEVSKPDFGEKKKIKMFKGGNGDFYLTVCPYNHNGGDTIRIETSGGASTINPRLMQSVNLMYLAIANKKDEFDSRIIKNLYCNISFNDIFKKILEITSSDYLSLKEKKEEIEEYNDYLCNNYRVIDK